MTSAAFDTLKLARALREKAKFSPEQAEGLADAMAEAMQGDIATKADITGVKADLMGVKTELRTEIRETELRLKAEIEASKAEVIKWMFGTVGFQTVIILGTVIALARRVPR